MNPIILLSTLALGIFGSLHCLGMCGPLALALPFPAQGKSKISRIVTYYLAKSLAYGVMGAVVGILGKVVMLMEWQQVLSVAAGIFILLLAFLPALRHRKGGFFLQKKISLLYTRLQSHPRPHYFFILGFLNGLLPCGLVYTALAAAVLAGGIAGGSLAMLLFGLGTTPALVLLILFKHKMSAGFRRRLLPASVIFSAAIGILLILRGLNLGLPYISPHVEKKEVSQCCHK